MILNLVIKLLFYFSAIAGLIMYMPGLLDIHPTVFKSSLPKSLSTFKSVQTYNVSSFEQFGSLPGPESIAVDHNGRVVTGSSDGWLYEIDSDNTFMPLLKIIDNGRPLGLTFSKGTLFVVEPSFGVYKVENVFDSKKRKVTLVFDIQQVGLG